MNEDEKNVDEELDEETTPNEEVEDEDINSDEDQQDEESSSDEETVPLKTYLDLKTKYKKIRKDHTNLKEKSLSEDLKNYKALKAQEYIDLGYDEALAEKLASDLVEMKQELSASKHNDFEDYLSDEIEELSKDRLFSDILDYKEEIIDKIKETKKKGFNLEVEDAYLLVSRQSFKNRSNLRDKKTNETQREIIRKKQKPGSSSTNVTTSSSGGNKVKYNLDEHDKIALAELQKMQPNAKWTPKKYIDTMK